MKKIKYMICVIMAMVLLAGCGTTSSLKSTKGSKFNFETSKKFSDVIVKKFSSNVSETDTTKDKIDWACNYFADIIANKIKEKAVFQKVSRDGTPTNSTLVISGEIIKYITGDPLLRAFIGLGAGSSYFDAVVHFFDGSTNQLIGSIDVNRNSWILGGVIAATQDPEGYMKEGAKKISQEVTKLAQ